MKPGRAIELDDWLPLAQGARERGIPERTFRRQLTALHAQRGGGVLRAYNRPGTKVRKWFFSPAAAKAVVERDADETQAMVGEVLLRVEELERKLSALRQAHVALKRRLVIRAT